MLIHVPFIIKQLFFLFFCFFTIRYWICLFFFTIRYWICRNRFSKNIQIVSNDIRKDHIQLLFNLLWKNQTQDASRNDAKGLKMGEKNDFH